MLVWVVVIVFWITASLLAWALVWVWVIAIVLIILIVFCPWFDLVDIAFSSFILLAIWVEVRIRIILWITWVNVWIVSVWVVLWLYVVEWIIRIHVRIVVWVVVHVAVGVIWVRAWLFLITVLFTIGIAASASDGSLVATARATAASAIPT